MEYYAWRGFTEGYSLFFSKDKKEGVKIISSKIYTTFIMSSTRESFYTRNILRSC